MLIIWR